MNGHCALWLLSRIQHSSIKVYLSGVTALHIEQGFSDPLANCLCLQRVVHGMKRSQDSYFGFLHASKFTVPSLASFSPSYHLGVQDIAVDSSSATSCMCLRIKGLKTDPFRKGAFIHIGLGRPPLCTVQLVQSYLTCRGEVPGPLFLFQSGQPLSRALLTDWLRQILASANIPGNFSSHSFRIGPPLLPLTMECPITSYKPWATGQALPLSFILGPRPSH